MMKIDKIDKEAEKRYKERMLEIKNKDIESLIKKTKQEIKEQERREREGISDPELDIGARMDVSHDEIDDQSPTRLPQQIEKP
jgi:hypothetical protein